MAKDVETGSQEKRATERTRPPTEKPFEELDAAAGRERGAGRGSFATGAKRAAGTALVAAVAGGLGGAAKALLDRRSAGSGEHEHDETPEPDDAPDEGKAAAASRDEPVEPEDTDDRDEATSEERAGDGPSAGDDVDAIEGEGAAPGADGPSDRSQEDEDQGEAEAAKELADAKAPRRDDSRKDPAEEKGAASDEVARIVEQARTQLQEVLGSEPESVSGIERSNGQWSVTLEVVDVRRIPDSTDVLSSYEVVLDDDGRIVRLHRVHRYRRSQVEEG